MSMRGGSGRGAFLRSLQGSTDESSKDTDSHTKPSVLDSGLGLSKCAGRGRFLLEKTDDSDNTPASATNTPSHDGSSSLSHATSGIEASFLPKPTSGRGKILQLLLEEKQKTLSSNVCFEEAVESATEELEEMNIEAVETEQDPVIRRGTKGRPVNIAANYIRLNTDPDKGVFEYEVRFAPAIHSLQLRYKLLNQHRDTIGNTRTFDGSVLYLPFLLPDSRTMLISNNDNDNSKVTVTIIFKKKKLLKDCIHLYNVLFERIMKILKLVRFGRKNFDPTAPKPIPQHKLEIWPGYVTAVDEYEDGVMLCLDVSHRLLCTETVLDILTHAYVSDKSNFQQKAMEALLGQVVLTRYNNKTYRIDDILFNESPQSTFTMSGKDVSYMEYYKNHYNIDLADTKQPLLLSREERRVSGKPDKETITFCLIPEICYLTGITDALRSDLKVMRDIATITRVTPNQRVDAMNTFCKNLNASKEATDVLKNWGLTLETNPLKLGGRQLEDEEILFGRGKTIIAERGDFNKYCCNNQLFKVINLTDWMVIHTKRDMKTAQNFIETIMTNSAPMGLKVNTPKVEVLNDDKNEQYVQLLRRVVNASLQIIVIICPSSRDDRYAAIKKVCCGELPIPTQVINSRTLANEAKSRSIIAKIALQMNCKMGGSLWSIKIPLKNVMICGIDTYHDTKKKDNSVGAFIASLNGTYTEWYSRAVIQSQKEELINGLAQALISALHAYKQRNDALPDKIIIYRDGVGDGQLKMVSEYELPQLVKACMLQNADYKPQFTFIVVQKRINTRLFLAKGKGFDNPAPGCIIDHSITRRFLYDFFLVPQNVRQGTVTPTHFIVLHDDNNYSPDVLQRLTYKMCFLYYNWPGTVRVPACCQYAHKLAFLVGQSVKKPPAEMLADKLYYL
ncbi:hypothetical protein HA402_014967 [Bradysia odoriphaga]|nr:hypothetical protein HA402_014967 [Bradysia odoriphaga]